MFRAHRLGSNKHSPRKRIQELRDSPLTRVIVGLRLSLPLEVIDSAECPRSLCQETFDLSGSHLTGWEGEFVAPRRFVSRAR